MKLLDYLRSNVGRTVYITGYGDLMMDGELRPLIRNKTPLILEKLTKGGKVCVLDGKKRYVIPPRNIHIIQDSEKSYAEIQDEHLRQELEKIRQGLPTTNEVRTREDFEKYKGQFVIIHGFEWQVERFIAIGKDEWDYLYITFDGREVHTHTILDRIVPLKGYIREDDYSEFIRLAKLNHADFLIDREEVRKNIEKDILGRGKITLMSEICLEL